MYKDVFKKTVSILIVLTMLMPWTTQVLISQAAENGAILSMSNEKVSEGDTGDIKLTDDAISNSELEHEITTPDALSIALEKVDSGEWDAHTLKLTDNITYPYPITLAGGYKVTIDLNGHTLIVQPDSTAKPNINHIPDYPGIAAIYVNQGSLEIIGDGKLDVVAGDGISYGIYTADEGSFNSLQDYADPTYDNYVTVTSTGGGTGIYATNKGTIYFSGSILVEGDDANGMVCLGGSNIYVSDNVSVTGDLVCGVYVESIDTNRSDARVGGNLIVSGDGSCAGLASGNSWLFIFNDATVTGNQSTGISAEGQESWVMVVGALTAPIEAAKAWNGGYVTVGNSEFEGSGKVTVTDENATAVSVVGASVAISGDVFSNGSSGIGISASAGESGDAVVGAMILIEGNIYASTPLLMEGQSVGESEHTGEHPEYYPDLYIYTDGTNIVYAKPSALIPTYTVSFNKNGGDTEANPALVKVVRDGNIGTLPAAPARSGYNFRGWNTQADGSGTALTATTVVTGSITVYAQWGRKSSGSGGASTPIEAPKTEIKITGNTVTAITTAKLTADNSDNQAVIVSKAQLSAAIDKAMEEAEKQGDGMVTKVEIKVETPPDSPTVATIIPKEALTQASEAGIDALNILNPVASIIFGSDALSSLSEQAEGDVKISATKVEASTLSPEAQQMVGDRPVFDFSITSGDKTISQFAGDVTVSIPYTPKHGEDISAIVIYYINASGKLEVVSNCFYDSNTGRISFSTSHFSQYVVGYNKINFNDVAEGSWYSKAVAFIAARKITSGTGNGNFAPEAKLTRGQFIVMLMKAYAILPDSNASDNFADAENTYYTDYLAAAKHLGITAGVGNNMFAPNHEITRQEMFTLLYNALKVINKLPIGDAGKSLSSYDDAQDIATWAKAAMKLMVETGAICGDGTKLCPTATTTRAEMAQLLYNLLSNQ